MPHYLDPPWPWSTPGWYAHNAGNACPSKADPHAVYAQLTICDAAGTSTQLECSVEGGRPGVKGRNQACPLLRLYPAPSRSNSTILTL